jgi:hypothetical protein
LRKDLSYIYSGAPRTTVGRPHTLYLLIYNPFAVPKTTVGMIIVAQSQPGPGLYTHRRYRLVCRTDRHGSGACLDCYVKRYSGVRYGPNRPALDPLSSALTVRIGYMGAGYAFDVPHTPAFDGLFRFDTIARNWKSLAPEQRPPTWPSRRLALTDLCW